MIAALVHLSEMLHRGGRKGHRWITTAVFLPALVAAGCGSDPLNPRTDADVYLEVSFADGTHEWEADIADYPPHNLEEINFVSEHRKSDAGIPAGYYLAGGNPQDDLFMFIKSHLEGLDPEHPYKAEFAIEFMTNSPSNCFGVGGSPGESVYVRAGATATEPVPVLVEDGYYRLNIEKGNQEQDGPASIVLGDVSNGVECGADPVWRAKQLRSTKHLVVQPSASGSVWLHFGTDSGYESRTELIITRVGAWFWKTG